VKWYLPGEELEDHARALRAAARRGDARFVAPDCFWSEIASAVASATLGRSARITAEQARAALADLMETYREQRVETVASAGLLPAAFELAHQHGCAIYDAIYVALAQQLGLPFLTADGKLYARIAHLPGARWLGDYAPDQT